MIIKQECEITKQECEIWIDALRSGKYKQGHGMLRTETSEGVEFCCLGVAQELFDLKHSSPDYVTPEWLKTAIQVELAYLNDDRNDSFSEIADHIEQKILPECIDAT